MIKVVEWLYGSRCTLFASTPHCCGPSSAYSTMLIRHLHVLAAVDDVAVLLPGCVRIKAVWRPHAVVELEFDVIVHQGHSHWTCVYMCDSQTDVTSWHMHHGRNN